MSLYIYSCALMAERVCLCMWAHAAFTVQIAENEKMDSERWKQMKPHKRCENCEHSAPLPNTTTYFSIYYALLFALTLALLSHFHRSYIQTHTHSLGKISLHHLSIVVLLMFLLFFDAWYFCLFLVHSYHSFRKYINEVYIMLRVCIILYFSCFFPE